jgi:hypothetical protein
MPVTIKTKSGHEMTVSQKHWTSTTNPEVAESLNADLEAGTVRFLPGDPAPDWNEARRVVVMLGGEILHGTPEPVDDPNGPPFIY